MQVAGRAYHVVASATEQLEICLGNIRLLAGMMLDEAPLLDGSQRHDYLRAIEHKASHLLSVTASLGDFARLGLRPAPLNLCELHVSEIAEQAVEAVTPLAARQRRLLVLAIGVGEPPIRGDYHQLLRAFTGLLRHSLSIAVPAAQILINLRSRTAGVWVEIDVPVEPAAPVEAAPSLSEMPSAPRNELAPALAGQVVELHGGSLRTLAGERHQRFVIELPAAAE